MTTAAPTLAVETPAEPRRRRKLLVWAGRVTLACVLAGMIGWGVLALYYSNLTAWLRPVAAVLFGIGPLAILWRVRPRRRGVLVFVGVFALLVIWWLRIPPSNDRDWQPDVAVLPFATIDGDRITIHNIRNCDYRSETDYGVRHYDRTYELDKLRTADLFLIYWGSPMIAHTMLSFGFDGGGYLCVSIETRKEKGEDYSAIRGFFRQYELTYVVADERDVVRLRTNYRHEDVYLYALQTTPDMVRSVFLDYLRHVNSLKEHPEWYNALTSNCTTNIRGHARAYVASPWDWRILLNGRIDELAYANGRLDQSLPFAELKARSHVNERANALDKDPAFSQRIREGLPGMEKRP
ncbi:MAG: DUF4105 domain-containing protein [Phycisphaerae bacterium]|nr:DUF4105 domain-containing protein [Phycisphaerae bacterium]